jgi:hypothetical protein
LNVTSHTFNKNEWLLKETKGGATDLKARGDKVCERSEHNFFLPPTLGSVGGTKNLIKYCKVHIVVFANFDKSCLLVARFARKICNAEAVFTQIHYE